MLAECATQCYVYDRRASGTLALHCSSRGAPTIYKRMRSKGQKSTVAFLQLATCAVLGASVLGHCVLLSRLQTVLDKVLWVMAHMAFFCPAVLELSLDIASGKLGPLSSFTGPWFVLVSSLPISRVI